MQKTKRKYPPDPPDVVRLRISQDYYRGGDIEKFWDYEKDPKLFDLYRHESFVVPRSLYEAWVALENEIRRHADEAGVG